jgi:hypothetical protein
VTRWRIYVLPLPCFAFRYTLLLCTCCENRTDKGSIMYYSCIVVWKSSAAFSPASEDRDREQLHHMTAFECLDGRIRLLWQSSACAAPLALGRMWVGTDAWWWGWLHMTLRSDQSLFCVPSPNLSFLCKLCDGPEHSGEAAEQWLLHSNGPMALVRH